MNITPAELRGQLDRFGRRRVRAVQRGLRAAGHHRHVDLGLVLAIFSRETNMQNEVGDGGHGRGIGQIDDRSHAGLLASVRGCRNFSFIPIYRSALPAGRVPTLRTAVIVVVQLIEAGVKRADQLGVPVGHRRRFACAAYNAGAGNAEAGWRRTGNPDVYTTGGDYGRDVMERATVLRAELRRRGWDL